MPSGAVLGASDATLSPRRQLSRSGTRRHLREGGREVVRRKVWEEIETESRRKGIRERGKWEWLLCLDSAREEGRKKETREEKLEEFVDKMDGMEKGSYSWRDGRETWVRVDGRGEERWSRSTKHV